MSKERDILKEELYDTLESHRELGMGRYVVEQEPPFTCVSIRLLYRDKEYSAVGFSKHNPTRRTHYPRAISELMGLRHNLTDWMDRHTDDDGTYMVAMCVLDGAVRDIGKAIGYCLEETPPETKADVWSAEFGVKCATDRAITKIVQQIMAERLVVEQVGEIKAYSPDVWYTPKDGAANEKEMPTCELGPDAHLIPMNLNPFAC